MLAGKFEVTGISVVIMNYCKALDKDKYDLTIIAGTPIAEQYVTEAEQSGVKIISLPSRHKALFKHYLALYKALKAGRYDIVHDHGNSSMIAIELTLAKWAGVKIRIAHSHNSVCSNMMLHKILNPYFKRTYTKALACGILAGDWLFGKNQFEVLPNGFNTNEFIFNEKDRTQIRKELHIENGFVIGHIGRFNEQKNQPFLLQVFEEIADHRKDAVLLLVGTGPDFESTKQLAEKHPYKNQIILYGETKNTSKIYSAMDIFVLPSRYEGLPVVLLEAQISGLPCITSDVVTKEMDFGKIQWESLVKEPCIWADRIMNTPVIENAARKQYYQDNFSKIKKFDISNTVNQLDAIYTDLLQHDKNY